LYTSNEALGFVGPVVAGILIGKFSESFLGIGLAFGIDAVTFAILAITLWLMRCDGKLPSSTNASDKESILVLYFINSVTYLSVAQILSLSIFR